MNEIESLRRLTETVEAAGADIAPTYIEYVQLAFAIATDCGEAGRDFFHRLCRISTKYQRDHADRVFSNALTTKQGKVHLASVFHLAETAGIDLSNENLQDIRKHAENAVNPPSKTLTHTCARNKVENSQNDETTENEELLSGSEPRQPLPNFLETNWPIFLKSIIGYGTTAAQRDVLLLGALTALGACMERHVRCAYAGKYQYPCMQTFIIAPSASGKSVLSYIRRLVEPIHDELRREYAEKMKAYKKEKAAYDAMGKARSTVDAPQMPVNKMFLIAGNNTGTGILQNIMDSDGTGLICETEADTISSAIGSDYGHWSDTLRKAFDHDRLSYNRRTDQEFREIHKCYLSLVVSGTPGQVIAFIPSTENGLFSRQLFLYMPGIHQWINQFDVDNKDLEEIFIALGFEWKKKVDLLKTHGVHTLQLTDEQKEEFNALFSDLFNRSILINGTEMNSSVARLAVNTCRIMSEVAVLRALENPQPYKLSESQKTWAFTPDYSIPKDNIKDNIITRWDVTISTEDFRSVLDLVKPLYRHATHILSFLPSTEIHHRWNADRDSFFEMLGPQFTRVQMLELATTLEIKRNTVLSWVQRMLKSKSLISVDGKGTYIYAHACGCIGDPQKSAFTACSQSPDTSAQ